MAGQATDYGQWSLVTINSLIFIIFAFSFTRPRTARDWRSFGAFSAFLVALFTEMYGVPLTIYLLSGWLSSSFPDVDWLAHDSGHLLETMFGWRSHPHVGPFHMLSTVFVFGGLILLGLAWRVLHRARRGHRVAMTGPYALVRHPQYAAFMSIMFGFLLQWPTLLTAVMFPALVFMYLRLAKLEEREALAEFGEEYGRYRNRTPAYFPRIGHELGLGAATLVILSALAAIAIISVPERKFAADASIGEGTHRVETNTLIGAEMSRQRVQLEAVKDQMRGLTGTAEPALRRDLLRVHLAELRRISGTPHAMNLKMIEDVDNRRMVSDPGLKQRLQLDADLGKMQLEMLRAETAAGDERVSGTPMNAITVQR